MLLHVDDLAALIERVLDEKGWTLSTLARKSGLVYSTLHSWKRGDRATGSRGPAPEKLRLLAKGAGLTVAEVFEAAGRHVPPPLADEDEQRFLHILREVGDQDRKILEATMQAMIERGRS
jgi:transcriptional regulator with XRE-family HTH domain